MEQQLRQESARRKKTEVEATWKVGRAQGGLHVHVFGGRRRGASAWLLWGCRLDVSCLLCCSLVGSHLAARCWDPALLAAYTAQL